LVKVPGSDFSDETMASLLALTGGFGADAVLECVGARAYQPELLKQVLDGSINPGKVFDLTTDLEHISEAYAAMDERRAIKALIKVSER